MTNLQQRLRETLDELPKHVQLVAVSKFHPAEAVTEAYAEGQRVFGESRVQELLPKHDALPGDIDWHFIGTLQRNKVKYIAPFVSLIHSVDNVTLLEEINKQGRRADMAKFGAAVHDLKKQGCDMAVLGCTELSLVKRDEHLGSFFIDRTEVLCRRALLACGITPIGF